MKLIRIIAVGLIMATLTACGGGGGGGGEAATEMYGAKEWLGKHEVSVPDSAGGTLILGGE